MISHNEVNRLISDRNDNIKKMCKYIYKELNSSMKIEINKGSKQLTYDIPYSSLKLEMEKYGITNEELEKTILEEITRKGFKYNLKLNYLTIYF